MKDLSKMSEQNCPICLNDTYPTYTTDCNHIFCKICIVTWFQKKSSFPCPICRTIIQITEEFSLLVLEREQRKQRKLAEREQREREQREQHNTALTEELTEELIKSSNQHSLEMRSNMIKALKEIRENILEYPILKELIP